MKFSIGNWQNIAIPFIYLSVAVLALSTVALVYHVYHWAWEGFIYMKGFLLRNEINAKTFNILVIR